MSYTLIFFEYLSWHYGAGVREFLKAWMNIHWFWYNFFSVPVLFKTFFKPFRRMGESYGRGFNPGQFFETLIVNLMMRIVGMVIRTVFLALGFISQAATLLLGAVLFLLYLATPAAIPVGFIFFAFLAVE